MKAILCAMLGFSLFVTSPALAGLKTDRENAALLGKVRRVERVYANMKEKFGQSVEEPSSKIIEEYNTQGNITETSYYDAVQGPTLQWVLRRKSILIYDAQDHRAEEALYDYALNKAGVLQLKNVYTYDAKQNRQEVTSHKPERSLAGKSIQTYDARGILTMLDMYKPDGSLNQKHIDTYDMMGNKTVATYAGDGTLMSQSHYSYDRLGNQTGWIHMNAEGSITSKGRSTYHDFDSVGNWRKSVTSVERTKVGKTAFEPVSVVYRTITYYSD
jgi:hypothetical protein